MLSVMVLCVITYYYKLLDDSCEENERHTFAKENKKDTRFQNMKTSYRTLIEEAQGFSIG